MLIASLLKPTSQQAYIYRKFTFSVVFVDKIISVALIYSRFLRFLNICCQTVCKLTVSNLFHSSPASFWLIVPKTLRHNTLKCPKQNLASSFHTIYGEKAKRSTDIAVILQAEYHGSSIRLWQILLLTQWYSAIAECLPRRRRAIRHASE